MYKKKPLQQNLGPCRRYKNEVKPIQPLKILDIIYRRRHVKNTQFYFTNRQFTEAHKAVKKPFHVPTQAQILSFKKFNEKIVKNHSREKNKVNIRFKRGLRDDLMKDISSRLFIEEPIDDIRTVLEIHPEFYSVIEGRPIRSHDDVKVYLSNIRSYAMLQQEIGYRNDMILQMDNAMNKENSEYEKIYMNYKHHVADFEQFLKEDHQKVLAKTSQIEHFVQKLNKKTLELENLATKVIMLNNALFKVDDVKNILKRYRNFLFKVSPVMWRRTYDEKYQMQALANLPSDMSIISIGDNLETEDVDRIILRTRGEFKKHKDANLYFTEPEQIYLLFRALEVQGRNYLTYLSNNAILQAKLKMCLNDLIEEIRQEEESYNFFLSWLERKIEQCTMNKDEIRNQFFNILNGEFFNTIASPSSLKLGICIKFCYDQLFGESKDISSSLIQPMRIMELLYETLSMKLDAMDPKIVNRARNEFFADDLRMMKKAHLAAQELKRFEEMSKNLRRAFMPPFKRKFGLQEQREEIGETSVFDIEAKRSRVKYKVDLELKDDLMLFTEWCEDVEPTRYIEQYMEFVKPVLERTTSNK